ncbi:MAG TPA: phosphoesterase, partial [Microbacterium sp.]|nr:phosphoesterase [Microbacterium sp.]
MPAPARRRLPIALSATLLSALTAGLLAPAAHAAPAAAVSEAAQAAAVVSTAPALVVTEILPDTVGVDDYEYFEVHNTTQAAIDLDAEGITFAYTYVDTSDRARDVTLATPASTRIDAGETVVFWVSYQSGSVDSFAHTVDDFRAHFAADEPADAYRVVRAT